MSILIRQVLIIDPSSPFHQQKLDLFIHQGSIRQVGQLSVQADQTIDIPGLHAAPGWTDVFAHFADPGQEYRETLESGAAAAAAGGYTDVLALPNTQPAVHNKSAVEYIVQKSKTLPVSIHPIGAVTKNTEGKELAEMYDMHQSGAVAFGDGISPIQSSGLLLKALQYVKAIRKTIIQLPDDRSISAGGLMNEGVVSTQLGLPGMPAIGEELMIRRDIELAKYTGSRLHITGISTANSAQMIRQAREEGLEVSCSVTPYHLYFCDEDLVDYDTNLKVNPPLRTRADKEALVQAVIDGIIDCIATHHLPQHIDHKIVEFEYAGYGMTGFETSYAVLRTAIPQLSPEQCVHLLSIRPRQIFDLPEPSIDADKAACLTLFLPDASWTVGRGKSKSGNNPFTGKELKGKPVGIINKDRLFLNQ
jgi:dihydroorotase